MDCAAPDSLYHFLFLFGKEQPRRDATQTACTLDRLCARVSVRVSSVWNQTSATQLDLVYLEVLVDNKVPLGDLTL